MRLTFANLVSPASLRTALLPLPGLPQPIYQTRGGYQGKGILAQISATNPPNCDHSSFDAVTVDTVKRSGNQNLGSDLPPVNLVQSFGNIRWYALLAEVGTEPVKP